MTYPLGDIEAIRDALLQSLPKIDPPVGLAYMEAHIQLATVRKVLCNVLRGAPTSQEVQGLLIAEQQLRVECETLTRLMEVA
jgi:hypothetical protein